ncbi:MAG: hypothetical protein ILO68_03650, partial [Clostridia bacterium]|nr:hypothetical protein [Clostridia bacterium]
MKTSYKVLALLLVVAMLSAFCTVFATAESAFLTADLGEVKALTGVKFAPTSGSAKVRISGSVDGENFYDLNAGGAVAVSEGVAFADFHTRGIFNVRYIRISDPDSESAPAGEVTTVEASAADAPLAKDPAGPYTMTGLNGSGYGIAVFTPADAPDGFGVNDKTVFHSNGRDVNLPGSQMTICERVDGELYRILWNDCNGWVSGVGATHTNKPEGVEGIRFENEKVYLADDQIVLIIMSSGSFAAAGDGEYSSAKWIMRGLGAGNYIRLEDDKVRLLLEDDRDYHDVIYNQVGDDPADPAFGTNMETEIDGDILKIRLTISDFKAADKISHILMPIYYDADRLIPDMEKNEDNSLNIFEGLPGDAWENLTVLIENDEHPRIFLQLLNAESPDQCCDEETEIVANLQFRMAEDCEEAGVWSVNGEVAALSWDGFERSGGAASAYVAARGTDDFEGYRRYLAAIAGEGNGDAFVTEMTAEVHGREAEVTLTVSGMRAEDKLSLFRIPVFYDTERLGLMMEKDEDGALQMIETLPNEKWEAFCMEEGGALILGAMNAEGEEYCCDADSKIVARMKFRILEPYGWGGLCLEPFKTFAENWEFECLYGKTSSVAFQAGSEVFIDLVAEDSYNYLTATDYEVTATALYHGENLAYDPDLLECGVFDADGNQIRGTEDGDIQISGSGNEFVFSFTLNTDDEDGAYTIRVWLADDEETFAEEGIEFAPQRPVLEVSADPEVIGEGEDSEFKVTVTLADNSPLPCSVRIGLRKKGETEWMRSLSTLTMENGNGSIRFSEIGLTEPELLEPGQYEAVAILFGDRDENETILEASAELLVLQVGTVIFKDWDGTVLSETTYRYGDTVEIPEDPTRQPDETYTYAFAGWDPEVVETMAGDAVYVATYTPTYIDYTIRFVDYNDELIEEQTYHYGETVVPPEDPTRDPDETYTYAFAAWDPEIVP